jgi:hypothetical protein
VGVAVDQARRHDRAAERHHLGSARSGKLGAAAHADDPAGMDADRGVADEAKRIAGRRDHRQAWQSVSRRSHMGQGCRRLLQQRQ